MGKKDKANKTGKGIKKTLAKTEKKLTTKYKKELNKINEEDIESILKHLNDVEEKRFETTIYKTVIPSRRVNFSFIPHPNKCELILFGGEFFDGRHTNVYKDLFFYNISDNTWSLWKTPEGPPPRCGHQMISTSANGGQLWLFGGEFISPSQSQFYHYRDLWVFHLQKKRWEQINAAKGPSSRSGHRMVFFKKQLIIFGGFYDNLIDYKYFNDCYSFNTESYTWSKLEITGTPPTARSACNMVVVNGTILIYGGYSKEKSKKDVDKGHIYTDAFFLIPDKHDSNCIKWKWKLIKLGGYKISPRCSMPMVSTTNGHLAYCFGGVFDNEENEESLSSKFFNDFLLLDLQKLTWKLLYIGKRDKPKIEDNLKTKKMSTTVCDDVLTISGNQSIYELPKSEIIDKVTTFKLSPRINCGMAIKHGILYLYGGMYENGNKQFTLGDFYSVDLKKLDEWKVIYSDNEVQLSWCGSDSESEKGDSNESDDEENDTEDTQN